MFQSFAKVAGARDTISNHPTLLNNLLSYWKLDEATDTTRFDSDTQAGTLNLSTAVSSIQVPGLIGFGAQSERGPSKYLSSTSQWTASTPDQWGVSMWINSHTFAGNNANFGAGIFGSILNEGRGSIQFSVTAGGDIKISTWHGAGATGVRAISTNQPVAGAGQWFHVLVDSAGVGVAGLFLSVNDTTVPLVDDGSPNVGWGAGTFIGVQWGASVDDYFFDGIIDEVAFWNRQHTFAEITDLYNEGEGLPYD